VDDLDRFLAFERRILAGMSTRAEPFDHGIAYFDDDVRDRYISNFLLIAPHQPQLSAETLLADAERILGGGGYRHRLLVVVDEADGDRLAPEFRAHGYVTEPSVQMVLRRPPDRPADLVAEECSFAESRPLTEEIYRREALTPDVIPRFVDQHESWERSIGARRFVARESIERLADAIASWIDVMPHGLKLVTDPFNRSRSLVKGCTTCSDESNAKIAASSSPALRPLSRK